MVIVDRALKSRAAENNPVRVGMIGAGFMARLHLPQPLKLHCQVKRVEPGRGMGVSVALAESESRKLYSDLLSSLTPPGV